MPTILDLKERTEILKDATVVLSKLAYVKEVYLFGSMLSGKITGASDIDLLIVIDDVDPKRAYLEIALALKEEQGERAYIIDIHVVSKNLLDEQPFKWLHKKIQKKYCRNHNNMTPHLSDRNYHHKHIEY